MYHARALPDDRPAIIGLIASRIPAVRTRWPVAIALTVARAVSATLLGGEPAASWAFVRVDHGEVAAVAARRLTQRR